MSDVPRSEIYDDVYFSVNGGMEETRHVFLSGNDLPGRWQEKAQYAIAETGFGTGLNFLMAWQLFDQTAKPGAMLDYVSVEKHPLSVEEIRAHLSPYREALSPYLGQFLAHYPLRVPGFHRMVFGDRVALTLIFDDVAEAFPQLEGQIDSWFLDGFTPSKNPAMWTQGLFDQMARLSHRETSFATFTAAGFVKRGLRQAGFHVEKKRGFAFKRDMLAGNFTGDVIRQERSAPQSVAIIGGGLAGCAAAYALKKYGMAPVIYDPSGLAAGVSGNFLGMINPRFSALRDGGSNFYTAGFAQAHRTLSQFDDIDLNYCGALHLMNTPEKEKRFPQTLQNWAWHNNHMALVNAQEASEIADISLDHAALYLAGSGYVSPLKLCKALAKGIPLVTEQITSLKNIQEGAIILANGIGVKEFYDLPVHSVRGQITEVGTMDASATLRCNLHYGGYFSASHQGRHAVGSSFQKWLTHTDHLPEDDAANIEGLIHAVPALAGNYPVLSARAGLRCASRDHFPLIGKVDKNILISTAHGSHGIVSALAGAHFLADCLRGGPASLAADSIKAINPGRFTSK